MHLANPDRLVLALGMAALVFLRHQQNIGRLLSGQEPKIGEAGSRA
jgi:glycerol-3-phosphate acyltransferase PlsY